MPNIKAPRYLAKIYDFYFGDPAYYAGHEEESDDLIACVMAVSTYDNRTRTIDLLNDLKTKLLNERIIKLQTPHGFDDDHIDESEIYKAISDLMDELISDTPEDEIFINSSNDVPKTEEPANIIIFVHVYKIP